MARALGVPVREVTMVSGATSRTKVIDIPADRELRWLELLAE